MHVFTMVLGYSRRIFARAYLSEGLRSLLDAHARAFDHFGGRTRSILYDNPPTVVLAKDEAAGQVVWNLTFKDRMDFYGVEVRLCRFYRAQTKGKVESGVKYIKHQSSRPSGGSTRRSRPTPPRRRPSSANTVPPDPIGDAASYFDEDYLDQALIRALKARARFHPDARGNLGILELGDFILPW